MRRAAATGLGTFLLVLLLRGVALAETPDEHTILLTATESQVDLRERLRTELTQGGWLVIELPPSTDAPSRVPDEVARHVHATVAMRIDPQGDVELWVVDPESGATVHHESIDTQPDEAPDVVSLRVVEVLRARLLKLGVSVPTAVSHAAEPQQAPPPETPPAVPPESAPKEPAGMTADHGQRALPSGGAPTARTPQTIDVSAAPIAAWSPGGLGLSAQIGVQGLYVFDRKWAIGIAGIVPIGSASVQEQMGTVAVSWGYAGISFERRFLYDHGGFALGVTAGVVAQYLSGEATAPYQGATDWVATGAALGRVGTRFNLSESLRVRLDGSLGAAAPRPVVMIADHRAATWGRPLLLLSLGLEWEAWQSRR